MKSGLNIILEVKNVITYKLKCMNFFIFIKNNMQ